MPRCPQIAPNCGKDRHDRCRGWAGISPCACPCHGSPSFPDRFTFLYGAAEVNVEWSQEAVDGLVGQVVNLTGFRSELVGLGRVLAARKVERGVEITVETIIDTEDGESDGSE